MVLDSLQVVVDVFEVVVGGCWNFWGGCRWLYVVLGGFRSFLVLVLTSDNEHDRRRLNERRNRIKTDAVTNETESV